MARPVAAYLLGAFGWSWTFWFAAPWIGGDSYPAMVSWITVGALGPALSALVLLRRQAQADRPAWPRDRLLLFAATLGLTLLVYLWRLQTGEKVIHGSRFTDGVALVWTPALVVGWLASAAGAAWVVSAARAGHPRVRERFASLIQVRHHAGWYAFALLFTAILLLCGHLLGTLRGTAMPPLLIEGKDLATWGPSLLQGMLMTCLLRGGLEEPGWRGYLLATLQRRFSPLSASLVIALFWNTWHIPLHLIGFYGTDLGVELFIARWLYEIPGSVLFTWLYNRTGSLLLLVLLHASMNNTALQVIPDSPLGPLVALAFVAVLVVHGRMYRKRASA